MAKRGRPKVYEAEGTELKKQYNKTHNRRKRQLIQDLKRVPCMDCGKTYPPYVMDFDHRDPSQKSFNITAQAGFHSIGELLEEVEKCDIVCSNCHRERTYGQR